MKYFALVWAGLWRKRMRTILTLLSVTVAFVLFGILHGVTATFDDVIDLNKFPLWLLFPGKGE